MKAVRSHKVYEGEERHIVLKAPNSNFWLDRDALLHSSLHKSENSGSLSKGRESRTFEWDKPRNHIKPYERTKSEE